MIAIINNLIDGNLILLSKAEENSLHLKNFKDDLGNKLQDPKAFAKIMIYKNLIAQNPGDEQCYKLTETGRQISENGGWLTYLKNTNTVEKKPKTEKPIKKLLVAFLTIAFMSFIVAFYYLLTNKK